MNKSNNLLLAAVIVMAGLTRTAQATLVLGPTTVSWPGSPGPDLAVTYSVDLTGSTYSYFYVITPPRDYGIESFTVNVSQQATMGNINSLAPVGAYIGDTVAPGLSVTWRFNNLTGTATNSFTSQYSPVVFGIGSATTAGLAGTWTSPNPDLPVPVPEGSTILAGMVMILPMGIGVCRALRKARGF